MEKLNVIKELVQILKKNEEISYQFNNYDELSVHVSAVSLKIKELVALDETNPAVIALQERASGIYSLLFDIEEKIELIGDHQGDLDGDMDLDADEREDKLTEIEGLSEDGEQRLDELKEELEKCDEEVAELEKSYMKEPGAEKN